MVAVLLVGTATRLLACFLWSEDLTLDRDAYLGIARNITAGNGFCTPETTTPTAYRPPVYPISLGIFFAVFPENIAVAVLNIAAGLATICGVWILMKQWWQPPLRQWLAAGFAIALDPLLLRYTAQPMTECLFTTLTVWTLVGVSSFFREGEAPAEPLRDNMLDPTSGSAGASPSPFLTGLLAGLAILCRPTLLPFIGLMTVI
ncbi:MAG TPA: hypothetical protein VFG20_08495, partial [Planctomycetaceae bacterium]|nr:hypothetical protein [Planctomycetaceae bacterium]